MNCKKEQLDHIYWLGGSPCAGKSSIADLLAEEYDLALYHIDDAVRRHHHHFAVDIHPCLYKWTHTPWNMLWMQPVEQLFAEVVACYREQFEIVVQELLATATDKKPLLVEGNSLMPDSVIEFLSESSKAIWLVPTETFQRKMYRRRGEWVNAILAECDDPDLAYQHWMDRDVAFACWIKERVTALNLPLLEVSGQRTIADNAKHVAKSLGLM